MESNLEQRMKKYAKKNSRKKIWLKILSVLSAAVVFCTTYALILPAITQEQFDKLPEIKEKDTFILKNAIPAKNSSAKNRKNISIPRNVMNLPSSVKFRKPKVTPTVRIVTRLKQLPV